MEEMENRPQKRRRSMLLKISRTTRLVQHLFLSFLFFSLLYFFRPSYIMLIMLEREMQRQSRNYNVFGCFFIFVIYIFVLFSVFECLFLCR